MLGERRNYCQTSKIIGHIPIGKVSFIEDKEGLFFFFLWMEKKRDLRPLIARRTSLSTMKSLDAKVQIFLEDNSLVFPGYGKKGLELKKIAIPTVESEGISDKMPKTSNKLLEALSDDDEVPFVDDVDGDPNWEDF
ncbi:hypothetical protein NPIL_163261 [Nephila pilipes]|uniref:Uncharacterized protein n=1 Tax=Nephila pilipes TaxID=299642 RepID=A0A8X6NU34_NEPPI|nr:hypothetical protein NPIL_163261 [Nephila pilipes]